MKKADFFIRECFRFIGCGLGFIVPDALLAGEKPNIIFFLVDDMGWMDCSVNGSKYFETPNIERLASMGKVFTNAYTANPLCSPTRASILTGRYPERFGLTMPSGHMPPNPDEILLEKTAESWKKMVEPKSRTFMPLQEITLAESLKKAGYATVHIGKWHLGYPEYWPEHQGFDINIGGGHYPVPPSYFSPYHIETLPDGPEREYITDRLTSEALSYIDSHKDTLFFMNFWHYAVHAPFQGHVELISKYSQKTDPRGMQSNAIMGAMIESMDKSLGLILDKLIEKGLLEKTIIVFFSDNGGNMYELVNGILPTNNAPLRYGKGNIHEGGIRVPCIISWPGKIAAGSVSDEAICSIDFYPTLLEAAGLKPEKDQEIDGVSLLPYLTQGSKINRSFIYFHFPHYVACMDNLPSSAVRFGQWKLIREYGEGANRTDKYYLYDLKKDIGEQHDLSAVYPSLVRKLNRKITHHLEQTGGIIPILNPEYNPDAESPMGKKLLFPLEKYPSY
jgi:arylsulfatase A-like enzyme